MKRLLSILIAMSFLIGSTPFAVATDQISWEDFECNISETDDNTVEIYVSSYTATDFANNGANSIVAKLTSNLGPSWTSSPSIIKPNSDFTFRFTQLKEEKYYCQISLISGGSQGQWSEKNDTRVGDEPICQLGYEYGSLWSLKGDSEIDQVEKCRVAAWTYDYFNDGFDKYFSISRSNYDSDPTLSGLGPDVEIFCDKKKIQVYVWVPNADSIGWSGSGQVRFDSGASKKVSYLLQRNFDGISINDTKSFMASLVKAKTSFGFKIFTVDGYSTVTYPKGNILEYRTLFAKAGCKF